MKALTIWQPYASLIGAGIKKIETRSWYTTYRGPILIHSGQRPMRWILKHSAEESLDVAIETFGMDDFMKLPTGRAICDLRRGSRGLQEDDGRVHRPAGSERDRRR